MSFLESVQHGLEKASKEAARLTKIQHLHNVVNDLTFKASQEGQTLVAQTMELYGSGHLTQGELTATCQQIATYQQQIAEVQTEIQRLQNEHEAASQQGAPVPPPPTGYPAYPQSYPTGTAQTGYPAPQAGYPAYPAPTGYPAYPAYPAPPQAAYPAYPTAAAPVASPSGEPPTQPGTPARHVQSSAQPLAVSNEPPTRPGRHAAPPPAEEPSAKSAPGSYAQGVLPPIYSPFANKAAAPAEAEPEKVSKGHHSTKKATDESAEMPVPEKKAHKTGGKQAE